MKWFNIENIKLQTLTLTKLNPYLAIVPILHSLKIPENLLFSGVSRGYKIGTLARNGLNKMDKLYHLKALKKSLLTSYV